MSSGMIISFLSNMAVLAIGVYLGYKMGRSYEKEFGVK